MSKPKSDFLQITAGSFLGLRGITMTICAWRYKDDKYENLKGKIDNSRQIKLLFHSKLSLQRWVARQFFVALSVFNSRYLFVCHPHLFLKSKKSATKACDSGNNFFNFLQNEEKHKQNCFFCDQGQKQFCQFWGHTFIIFCLKIFL